MAKGQKNHTRVKIINLKSKIYRNYRDFAIIHWTGQTICGKCVYFYNTSLNKSRNWPINSVNNKNSSPSFESSILQTISPKISCHLVYYSTVLLVTLLFVFLKRWIITNFGLWSNIVFWWKKYGGSSGLASKTLSAVCTVESNHLSVVCWLQTRPYRHKWCWALRTPKWGCYCRKHQKSA